MLGAIPALVGRADGRGDGQDITVISWIGMVHISLGCMQAVRPFGAGAPPNSRLSPLQVGVSIIESRE